MHSTGREGWAWTCGMREEGGRPRRAAPTTTAPGAGGHIGPPLRDRVSDDG